MKKFVCLLLALSFVVFAYAQNNIKTQVAQHIADKLKDSLSLSGGQRDSIYAINLLLADRKDSVRSATTEPEALQLGIQQVERTRDSLYRPVLLEEKYLLYKQRKRTLLSAN